MLDAGERERQIMACEVGLGKTRKAHKEDCSPGVAVLRRSAAKSKVYCRVLSVLGSCRVPVACPWPAQRAWGSLL